MIYEKKSEMDKRAKNEDFSHNAFSIRENDSVSVYEKEEIVPYVTEHIPERRIKRRKRRFFRRNRRNMHKGRLVVLMTATLLICAFILDARVFDARLREGMLSLAESGLRHVAEYTSGENLVQTSGMRTLYTLDYYDALQKNDNAQGTSSSDVSDDTKKTDDEITVPADSNRGESFVDGVRFYPITAQDLSTDDPLTLVNQTTFTPDMKSIETKQPSSLDGLETTDGPLVLIVHTHACESYTEYEGMYPETEETRSQDIDKNIVRVGGEISQTLADFGITAVHCTRLHDKESFINAYTYSANSVKEYLEKYPSIRFVIDVHRDAVIRDDGESIKAVSNIAGEDYAQLMLVVGTNQLGHNHPDWQDNLSLALSLQKSMLDTYPSLCRSINLRNVPFNQQLSSGYLLLEVGTSANTMDEALRSARAFGENLARVIMST